MFIRFIFILFYFYSFLFSALPNFSIKELDNCKFKICFKYSINYKTYSVCNELSASDLSSSYLCETTNEKSELFVNKLQKFEDVWAKKIKENYSSKSSSCFQDSSGASNFKLTGSSYYSIGMGWYYGYTYTLKRCKFDTSLFSALPVFSPFLRSDGHMMSFNEVQAKFPSSYFKDYSELFYTINPDGSYSVSNKYDNIIGSLVETSIIYPDGSTFYSKKDVNNNFIYDEFKSKNFITTTKKDISGNIVESVTQYSDGSFDIGTYNNDGTYYYNQYDNNNFKTGDFTYFKNSNGDFLLKATEYSSDGSSFVYYSDYNGYEYGETYNKSGVFSSGVVYKDGVKIGDYNSALVSSDFDNLEKFNPSPSYAGEMHGYSQPLKIKQCNLFCLSFGGVNPNSASNSCQCNNPVRLTKEQFCKRFCDAKNLPVFKCYENKRGFVDPICGNFESIRPVVTENPSLVVKPIEPSLPVPIFPNPNVPIIPIIPIKPEIPDLDILPIQPILPPPATEGDTNPLQPILPPPATEGDTNPQLTPPVGGNLGNYNHSAVAGSGISDSQFNSIISSINNLNNKLSNVSSGINVNVDLSSVNKNLGVIDSHITGDGISDLPSPVYSYEKTEDIEYSNFFSSTSNKITEILNKYEYTKNIIENKRFNFGLSASSTCNLKIVVFGRSIDFYSSKTREFFHSISVYVVSIFSILFWFGVFKFILFFIKV